MRTLLIAITLAATSSAMASVPPSVPDTGSASLMLVAAVSGLILGRSFLRRR